MSSSESRINEASDRLLENKLALEFLKDRYGWVFSTIFEARIGLEEDRFLFPSEEPDGTWRFTTRQWNGSGPKYKHELPAMGIYLPRNKNRSAYLCEGHADTITAQYELSVRAMGLVGTSTVSTAMEYLKDTPEISILMDADSAGWRAMENLYNALWKTNTKVNIVFLIPPDRRTSMIEKWGTSEFKSEYVAYDYDLSEYVKQYGKAEAIKTLETPYNGFPVHKLLYKEPQVRTRPMFKTSVDFGALAKGLECSAVRCMCQTVLGRGWGLSHCPSHEDTSPSLSLKLTSGVTLVHCFGGCDQNTVVSTLKERGLWHERNFTSGSPGGRASRNLSHSGNWGTRPARDGGVVN